MDPDMNIYDLEHVTTAHPLMSAQQLQGIYDRAWDIYYSPEHVKTLFRRAAAGPGKSIKLVAMILWFYGMVRYEKVHPLQAGAWRVKDHTQRRRGLARENPLLLYARRVWQIVNTYVPMILMYRRLLKVHAHISNDPAARDYMDIAITPVVEGAQLEDGLDLFNATQAARSSVAHTRESAKRVRNAGLASIEVVVTNSSA